MRDLAYGIELALRICREPSSILKRLDLRWKDDPSEKEAKGKQETDERGHNEDGHEE